MLVVRPDKNNPIKNLRIIGDQVRKNPCSSEILSPVWSSPFQSEGHSKVINS